MTDPPADVPPDLAALADELTEAAALAGFDLLAHTTVAAYHRALGLRTDDGAFRLPDFPAHRLAAFAPGPGAADPSRAVFLLGNTRALWPHFMGTLDAQPARRSEPHPFDRWTSERVSRLVIDVVGPHYAFDVRYVFEGGVRAFSALHLAEASGLAYRGPAGLAVNPRFGPWFALRAAIVVDLPGREASAPDALCERCLDKPCLAALPRALGDSPRAPAELEHGQVRERWRDWLAVRDACPIAPAERYSDAQIRWHYAHDRSALE